VLQLVSDAMAEREQDSRLLAEEAEETLERYHLALEAGGLAIWDWDVDASSIRRSPDAEALFGLPRESTGPAELLFLRRVHPDDRARVLPVVRKAAATGDPFTLEYRLVLPDGRIRHVVDVGRPGARSAGSKRMHGAMKDVTAEREAQEALREREAASRAVLDSLPAETVVVARDGTILAANTAWLGGSAGDDGTVWPVGENYLERWASRPGLSPRMRAATLDGIRAVMARTATEHVQEYDVEPAGRWFELRVLPLHASSGDVIISHYDITDRKAVEAALRHSQKMESLGQLAGGVAHDFNNLLTAISGYAELARERLAAGELSAASTELHELERAAGRGAELVAQLLAFSRRRPAKVEPARAGDTIAGLQSLLGRLLGAHVRVEVSVADSGVVPVDATQLEQVVINLAVNARDAMPAGGSVTISTRDVVVDGGRGETADLAPGPYVELEVRDSGCGMPPEVLAHVWEPFFTTKGEAGTGLGLPMVYGTVTQAGGQVTIESEPGEGTSVRILLPRRARTATAGGAASAPSAPAPPPGQAVLLVEDQAQVRHLLTAALERLGYSVLSASDGPSALDLVEGGADVDLLLTDVVMPAMNGVELAERMRARLPGVRVLFMSGYTHDVAVHDAGGLSFLQKPFSLTELATAVREAIADQPADG
jgi:PAS domain S-box-containing protein